MKTLFQKSPMLLWVHLAYIFLIWAGWEKEIQNWSTVFLITGVIALGAEMIKAAYHEMNVVDLSLSILLFAALPALMVGFEELRCSTYLLLTIFQALDAVAGTAIALQVAYKTSSLSR